MVSAQPIGMNVLAGRNKISKLVETSCDFARASGKKEVEFEV